MIRPGKTPRVFDEGFISDDGRRMLTSSLVPPERVGPLSAVFHDAGLILTGGRIERVDKFNFYFEPFAIMRVHDGEGILLGYYCDITTPLERTSTGYRRTDLFLDLWINPDGSQVVLDEDELEEALQNAVISPEQGEFARRALERMLAETAQGVFPARYIA